MSDLDSEPGVSEDAARAVATKCLKALEAPLQLNGKEQPLGLSIGIALGNARSAANVLLSAADCAMYEAKQAGRGVTCLPTRLWALARTLAISPARSAVTAILGRVSLGQDGQASVWRKPAQHLNAVMRKSIQCTIWSIKFLGGAPLMMYVQNEHRLRCGF